MTKINDLSQGNLGDLARQQHQDRYATPLNGSSVGSGGMRFYGSGMLTVENEGFRVTGTAEIIGRLLASGIIDFTGTVSVSGPMTVTGLMTLMSNLVVSSGGKITAGSIELNPDGSAKFGTMTISPAGVITSGNVVIDPSSSNGGFTFASGGGVGGDGGAVLLRGSSNAGVLATDTASLFAGAASVDVRTDGVYVPGLPETSEAPNLYANSSGKLFRCV